MVPHGMGAVYQVKVLSGERISLTHALQECSFLTNQTEISRILLSRRIRLVYSREQDRFRFMVYLISSLTTWPARSSPAAEGTKEMLPGTWRRIRQERDDPGGQMQPSWQADSPLRMGTWGGSLE